MPSVLTSMEKEAFFSATFHTTAVNILNFISQSSTQYGNIDISCVIVIDIYFSSSSSLYSFADAPGGIGRE